MGDKMMFSKTVMCGKRLKRWKTMPTSLRTLLMLLASFMLMPSTMISPAVGSSR